MKAFRLTHLGPVAQAIIALALSARAAHAQGTAEPAPAPSTVEPAAPAPTTPPAPAAAPVTPAADTAARAVTTDSAGDAKAAADAEAEAEAAAAAASAGTESAGKGESADEFKLNLYGFSDFTYTTFFKYFNFAPTPHSSFSVGKLNLYAGGELGNNWRALSEIRFMYLPNGASPPLGPGAPVPRTDTTVADYTDLGRPVRWGGVSIERAWLEHTFHPALTVRVGQFLTPYGIWNVDHGSPVIIPVHRPYIIGEALFPEHQTGIETYGTFNFGRSQVGYHLTLSNGRGPIDTYQDLDGNKAIGGRLFFKHDGDFGTLTVGTSAYRGRYTDNHPEYSFSAAGLVTNTVTTLQYEELALAADAKWEWGGLLVQSELIMNDKAYSDPGRPTAIGFPPPFTADHRSYGVYGLAGYRTPWLGVMPFIQVDHYNDGFSTPIDAVIPGVNVRPTARVVLKAEFTHAWFTKKFAGTDGGVVSSLDMQAAWSF